MTEDLKVEAVNEERTENIGEQQKSQPVQMESTNSSSMNLALVGGLVGAGIGLFLNPEKTKQVLRNISESDFAKMAGREFRIAAQNVVAAQAQQRISQLAATNDGKQSEDSTQSYEELKNENQSLNERLNKIEEMLNELAESKEA